MNNIMARATKFVNTDLSIMMNGGKVKILAAFL